MNHDDERDYAEEAENSQIDRDEVDHLHQWVSGMMYVDSEDLHQVAVMRQDAGETLPECEICGIVYALWAA